ncbi:MAG: polysaccharide deacetylase family protein [Thaumarchaeota archaeon]|nr:MAG: polysaccharide deacetylase family protein [Nitrososphaerota archaeon]
MQSDYKIEFTRFNFCTLSIFIGFVLLFLCFQQFDFGHGLHAQSGTSITSDKVVILNFDDGRKTQFTQGKPILDKYGFKATFYVVCNYLENKPGYMDWNEVKQLYDEGHDIGSHSMNHANLSELSKKDVKFEVGESKKCLEDHGIDVTSFAYPFNEGSNDKKIIKIVSKYYELARTAGSPITYLQCDGWKAQSNQKDCSTYTKKEDLTFANRFSIRGWSHDASRLYNSYNDSQLLNNFIKIVNSQNKYNKNGNIQAIPIIIYHRAGDKQGVDYNTDLKLFEKEMKYLHDNNFRVITMKDLGYEKRTNYLYIKSPNESLLTGGIASVSGDK